VGRDEWRAEGGEGVRQTHFISDLLTFDFINHYFFLKREALEVLCEGLWMEKKTGGFG